MIRSRTVSDRQSEQRRTWRVHVLPSSPETNTEAESDALSVSLPAATFGPPLISVDVEDNSAIVTLKGPMRYQSHNLTPVVSMTTVYPQLSYNLSVHNMRRDRMVGGTRRCGHMFLSETTFDCERPNLCVGP